MSEWVEYMTFKGVSPMADMRKKNGREEPWRVDYFGVGNESWGCGGNMRPRYYADEYRRYQTYVRSYDSENKINKICCGASGDDYNWTKKVLEVAFEEAQPDTNGFMDGLSLHYYVQPDDWNHKGSAIDFNEAGWYKTLKAALFMNTLIEKHGKIMDEYDPDKKIAMIIDEWGCWFDVEPGTNPGFLFQQNTMRDALVAGITLNIFNKHCDRVKMANIAQAVNVLQAVILTEGEKMVKTPTYHVFHMYRHHQHAKLLDSTLLDVNETGLGEWKIPELTESVSVNDNGVITITINNLSLTIDKDVIIKCTENMKAYRVLEANILTGKMNQYNNFENPEMVKEEMFTDYNLTDEGVKVKIPSCSILEIRLNRNDVQIEQK